MLKDLYKTLVTESVDEGIYSDPEVYRRDATDDLVDQYDGKPAPPPKPKPQLVHPSAAPLDLELAFKAIKNVEKAKTVARASAGYKQKLMSNLSRVVSIANDMMGSLRMPAVPAKPVTEASMGVGSSQVRGGPEGDAPGAGTGIPLKRPIVRKKMRAKKLNFGSPANSGMVGTNPMVPGRSAFAKGE